MTRRKLTPEEIELWHRVVEKAERLHSGSGLPTRHLPKPKPARPMKRPDKPTNGITPGPRGEPAAPAITPAVQMDKKTFARMKRGKTEPEARLDLHGMTLDRAHPALIRFVLSSQASGLRLVLVITGKGKSSDDRGPIPSPGGVLKRQVPHWLNSPPLAQAVLQVAEAHQRHGGSGALYVYLRRSR